MTQTAHISAMEIPGPRLTRKVDASSIPDSQQMPTDAASEISETLKEKKAEKARMPATPDAVKDQKVKIAVFDFDGTCIAGKSPLLLTLHLLKSHDLRLWEGIKSGLWGVGYKMHLPMLNQSWVRSMVFRAFSGRPKDEVDRELHDFYDQEIAQLFRPELEEAILKHKESGRVVMLVSATFEPIIQRMMEFYPFDFQISTRMGTDRRGCYTERVEGLPVEGPEKVASIRRFANERYGVGNWEIDYAYSDHYSDRPLLYAAQHPYAVEPDTLLKRTAKREGWPILVG